MNPAVTSGPAIPDDNAPLPPARRPTNWTVRRGRTIAFVCVGLAVALSLVATYVAWQSAEAADARAVDVEQRLDALEEYVQGRGEYRDREAERLGERITEGICDLLDQLPPSPLLDVPRGKYGCGPGVQTPAAPPAAAPSPAAAPAGGPTPSASAPRAPSASNERPASAPPAAPRPPANSTGAPPPSPPSPTDPSPPSESRPLLEPVTDALCDALGVCL